jgi:hypothetical protein
MHFKINLQHKKGFLREKLFFLGTFFRQQNLTWSECGIIIYLKIGETQILPLTAKLILLNAKKALFRPKSEFLVKN